MNEEIYKQEIEDWNKNTAFYENENLMPYQEKIYRKQIYEFYDIKKEERVLDVGGGTTNVSENTIIVDFSPKMIEACKETNGAGKCILASAHNLPFKNQEFDVIIANGLFHHLKVQGIFEESVKEFYRVLKPNGRICIFDRADNLFPRILFILRKPFKILLKPKSTCSTRNESKFLEEDIERIKRGGFEMVRKKYVINVFFQTITIFANVLQYIFGYKVAYCWQKLTWPIAFLLEKMFSFKIFCAEQLIVMEKR